MTKSYGERLGSAKNQGQRQHIKNETARKHGQLKDVNGQNMEQNGIEVVAKRLYGGAGELSTGDKTVIRGASVQCFDGAARFVDSNIWHAETQSVMKYEQFILDMAEVFLKGGNALCRKYTGNFYRYLTPLRGGQWNRGDFDDLARASDIDDDLLGEDLYQADGRPSSLRAMSELSDKYPAAIMKLKLVIRWCAFVFSEEGAMPELPEGEARNTAITNNIARPRADGENRNVATFSNKKALEAI